MLITNRHVTLELSLQTNKKTILHNILIISYDVECTKSIHSALSIYSQKVHISLVSSIERHLLNKKQQFMCFAVIILNKHELSSCF